MWVKLPFSSSPVVLRVAASALASASSCFCSVLFLLPPSEQTQHFKSHFLTAGNESCRIFCSERSQTMDYSLNFSFLCVALPICGINIRASILPLFILWPQTSLGTMDLGQVYYEPLKDRQGNVLLVTLKEFLNTSRWQRFIVQS